MYTLSIRSLIFLSCPDQTDFVLPPRLELRSLRKDGSQSQEISSASNIGDSWWERRSPNYPPCTEYARTSHGMTSSPIGRNKKGYPSLVCIDKNKEDFFFLFNWYIYVLPSVDSPFKRSKKNGAVKPKGYWREREHQRQYLIEFAESMGFDPLVPENWKNITKTMICSRKVKFQFFQMLSSHILFIEGTHLVGNNNFEERTAECFSWATVYRY